MGKIQEACEGCDGPMSKITIVGKYTGKDDPVMLVRTQMDFPATGEVLQPFAVGPLWNMIAGKDMLLRSSYLWAHTSIIILWTRHRFRMYEASSNDTPP